MKSLRLYFLTLLSLNLCGLFAQQEHYVTLSVNTAEIQNPNVNDYCNFGQPEGIANEEFTIEANVGDTIIWRGISVSSPGDVVLIEAINHEGNRAGRDIFGSNVLQGQNGEVRGTILYSTAGGADYKYKLSFRVIQNGEPRGGMFHIDPKIRVR